MNPKELKIIDVSDDKSGIYFYPASVGVKVPTFCFILAGFVFIAGMSGALLIKRNQTQALKDKMSFKRTTCMNRETKQTMTHRLSESNKLKLNKFLTDVDGSSRDFLSVKESVQTSQFKYLVAMFMLLSSSQLLLIMNIKGYVL